MTQWHLQCRSCWRGGGWGGSGPHPCHPPSPCPQMRCLTTPTLLRALAQAARAGRTWGAFPGCGGARVPGRGRSCTA